MKKNSIQFAVCREDSDFERLWVEEIKAKRALLVGSGGCHYFNLKSYDPHLQISIFDTNPAQIELIKRKISALKDASFDPSLWNIENPQTEGLNACGNFESLFRSFRLFVQEFIWEGRRWREFFESSTDPAQLRREVFSHPYWKVAFELFFSDHLLHVMFGPKATQNAASGSYPHYFRIRLEKGLLAPTAKQNYFLHHIFLGHYLNRTGSLPPYLVSRPDKAALNFTCYLGELFSVPDLETYDLISLSNIFDWMGHEEIVRVCGSLKSRVKGGSCVLLRQLNNSAVYDHLLNGFERSPDFEEEWRIRDRSLFYSHYRVYRKISL